MCGAVFGSWVVMWKQIRLNKREKFIILFVHIIALVVSRTHILQNTKHMLVIQYQISETPFATPCSYTTWFHNMAIQKRRQRSSLLLGGQNWFNSLPRYLFCTMTIWRIGCNSANKMGMNSSFYSHNPGSKKFCPPSSSDDLCLLFCIAMLWNHVV